MSLLKQYTLDYDPATGSPVPVGPIYYITSTGADPTGTVDARLPIQQLVDRVSALGGGAINVSGGRWLIDSADLIVRANVFFVGAWSNAGDVTNIAGRINYTECLGIFIVNPSFTIRLLGDSCGLTGIIVIRKNLIMPVDAGTAAAAVAAFAGTAITIGNSVANTANDTWLSNLLILGFGQAIFSDFAARPRMSYIFFDCLAGIWITRCYDMNHMSHCHGWPIVTQTYTNAFKRSGTAYYFGGPDGPCDWGQADTCFSYFYGIGFHINSSDYTTMVNCGADAYFPAGDTTTIGFLIDGTSKAASLIGCKSAAQGDNVNVNITGSVEQIVMITNHRSWGSVTNLYNLIAGNTCLVNCHGQTTRTLTIADTVSEVSFIGGDYTGVSRNIAPGASVRVNYWNAKGFSSQLAEEIIGYVSTGTSPTVNYLSANDALPGWQIVHAKAASGTTIVTTGMQLCNTSFEAFDGLVYKNAAYDRVEVVGTPTAGIIQAQRRFYTADVAGSLVENMRLIAGGGAAVGTVGVVLPANATVGFLHIPTIAADPSGAPSILTGATPICINPTDSKLWAYIGGAWKGIVLA